MSLEVGTGAALEVVEAEDLDACLDEIERTLTEPTLVMLANGDATMHIGLGDLTHSIALFLDRDGRCWASSGTETTAVLVFRSGDTCHDFYPSTAIPTDQARLAAREFAATGRQPTTITWRQEPGQRHA